RNPSAAIVGVSHRGAARLRRGSATQPGQIGHGGVAKRVRTALLSSNHGLVPTGTRSNAVETGTGRKPEGPDASSTTRDRVMLLTITFRAACYGLGLSAAQESRAGSLRRAVFWASAHFLSRSRA